MRVCALNPYGFPDGSDMIRPAEAPFYPKFQPQQWAEFYARIRMWSYTGVINGDAFSGTLENLVVVSNPPVGPSNELQILKYHNTAGGSQIGSINAAFFFSVRYYIDENGFYVPSVGVTISTSTQGVTTQVTPVHAAEFSGSILGHDIGDFYSLSDGSEGGNIAINGEQWWEYRNAAGENPIYNQADGTLL